ncbi:MAG TPA: serine hydrolase [Chitinophagaceae bacterium]|nr:serine hydrolase [Chitinophagaceae bacterium]
MLKNRVLFLFILALFTLSCSTSKRMKYNVTPSGEVKSETRTEEYLEQLLSDDKMLKPFLAQKDSLMIQVIYTQIDRDKNNKPVFRDYYFNVNPARYFYPASTVKMPTAMLALEKLNKAQLPGLDASTTMVTGKGYGRQTEVLVDPSSPDGRPTIGQYVKKVFLVSDNDAQNRMYEFLGQKYLNETLRSKGYPETEIIHRLQIALPEEENRRTNPVSFYDNNGKKIWAQDLAFNETPYFKRHDFVGKGYMINGVEIEEPMGFSNKNRISLPTLHNVLKSIMFPNSVKAENKFQVSDQDLAMVRKYMSMWPGESDFPSYKGPDYYPAYCKFLLYGADKNASLLPGVRIFNKVGDAYGFLLDIAYVADFDKGIEFMLSAVIYCNKDGILNDDKYDYEEVGFPFMKYLGERIYAQELKRPREHKPDLSEFKFQY